MAINESNHGMRGPTLAPLPLDEAWPEIQTALKAHKNLVLVAEPGAGKTTRFPPLLLRSGLLQTGKKVLMLEPRRLAARASAHRIAKEQCWRLGDEVGYQVRFENRSSPSTPLLVLTEGLLARRLQSDPELKDVGAVILDEFHERSQHTDLAIGLLFELQELARPDLRIIVMSATLDAEKAASFLGQCPIVRVPGRTYPVDIQNARYPLLLDTSSAFLDQVAQTTLEVLQGQRAGDGDILVFLPGAREIRGVRERLAPRTASINVDCLELHGSLPLEEQDRAIRKNQSRRKVVLATNIAETSLTIDGVGTVIDSGLARVMRIDGLGFPKLLLSRISLASATQRAGRAGRQGPGYCHRLWSKMDEASMPAFEQPEIMRTDLADTLLTLATQGVTDPHGFSWFEKPADETIEAGESLLRQLNFKDASGNLTADGREAAKLPLPARLCRLLLEAVASEQQDPRGQIHLAARMAALLSEKDIAMNARDLKRLAQIESDLLLRLHLLEERYRGGEIDHAAVRNVLRVADAIANSAARVRLPNRGPSSAWSKGLSLDEIASRLLLLAFPDRVCRRRRAKEPAALMVGGRGSSLAPFSSVETAELFLALATGEARGSNAQTRNETLITISSRIERSWMERHFSHLLQKRSIVIFNEETGAAQRQTALSYRDLPIEESHLSKPNPEEAFPVLLAACRERWSTYFAAHEDLHALSERIAFLRQHFPELLTDETSLESPNLLREAFLEEACYGETKISDVLSKPLAEIFLRHLPQEIARLLDEAAPSSILVPSGNRIRLHYPPDRPPYLEVRIQEVFGLRSSPKVARGRVSIALHLLGPNFRPVQVTSDLESFWKNGYVEVRKELRARYPKHSWPDDPLSATPEAKGGRRRS